MHHFDDEDIRRDVESAVRSAMENMQDTMHTVSDSLRGVSEGLGALGPDLRETFGADNDPNAAVESGDVVDQVHTVEIPAELVLRTVSGTVTVRGSETSTIRVHAVKTGRQSARDNTVIEYAVEGNRVTLRTRAVDTTKGVFGMNILGGTLASVEYEIEVPRRCAVRVNAVSADVRIEGTTGAVEAKTVSGDVRLAAIDGSATVQTVSGDVEGHHLRGELTVRTTSGDTRFRSCTFTGFNLHSVSGDYTIETPLVNGETYMARTVSGDLHLRVPSATGAMVQLKSVSGDSRVTDLPVEVIKSGRRRWQGRIGQGGANVEMNSVSGDLRVSANGETGATFTPGPVLAAPEPAPESPEKRQETAGILEQLAHGEIDVEEAMSRLRALE